MKLKSPLLLLLFVYLSYTCVGQHVRHTESQAFSSSNCLADSIKLTLISLQHKADAIITFQHYYDNGSPESATVFWQIAGKSYAKYLQGCNPSITPAMHLPSDTLFAFYRQQNIAELPKMAMPASAPSHGMAYFIGVYLPSKTSFYNIRECQRHLLIYSNSTALLPRETEDAPHEDPRSIWVDLFEEVTKR